MPSGWLTLISLEATRTKCPVVKPALVSPIPVRRRGQRVEITVFFMQRLELKVLVTDPDVTNMPQPAERGDEWARYVGER
jgi:hypothetical protein